MNKPARVPVTERAMAQRLNRVLKEEDLTLKKSRGERALIELGDWYIVNYRYNRIIEKDVDIEDLGRERGVLAKWESVYREK